MSSIRSAKNSPVDDAVEQVTGRAQKVVDEIEDLVKQAGRHNSASNAQIHVHAGGLINAFLACGLGVCVLALVLGGVWFQITVSEVRTELRQTRQDLQDQQAAWVSVMQSKVNEAKQTKPPGG